MRAQQQLNCKHVQIGANFGQFDVTLHPIAACITLMMHRRAIFVLGLFLEKGQFCKSCIFNAWTKFAFHRVYYLLAIVFMDYTG